MSIFVYLLSTLIRKLSLVKAIALPRLHVVSSLTGGDLHAACVQGISDIECWDGECIKTQEMYLQT